MQYSIIFPLNFHWDVIAKGGLGIHPGRGNSAQRPRDAQDRPGSSDAHDLKISTMGSISWTSIYIILHLSTMILWSDRFLNDFLRYGLLNISNWYHCIVDHITLAKKNTIKRKPVDELFYVSVGVYATVPWVWTMWFLRWENFFCPWLTWRLVVWP